MKKLAKKALQNKQTVRGYANCTTACVSNCPVLPTHAVGESKIYQSNNEFYNGNA